MKSKILFLIISLSLLKIEFIFADSPLTSTPFSDAYGDVEIIIKASNTNGVLTPEIIEYLINENNPIDIKMAVINKIGWSIEGKTNSAIFLKYLNDNKKKGYDTREKLLSKASAAELLTLAYLKALDNYFNVEEAIIYATAALLKNSTSYTFNIITALIKAQKAMDKNWCEVYTLTNNVRINKSLTKDMKDSAVEIIFKYMDIYREYCK